MSGEEPEEKRKLSIARGGGALSGIAKYKEFVNGTSMFTEALLSRYCNFHFIVYSHCL